MTVPLVRQSTFKIGRVVSTDSKCHALVNLVLRIKSILHAHVKHTCRLVSSNLWTSQPMKSLQVDERTWRDYFHVGSHAKCESVGAISCVKFGQYILVIADSLIYSCSTNSKWNAMCICCNCQQRAFYIWFFVPLFSEIARRISSGDTVRSGMGLYIVCTMLPYAVWLPLTRDIIQREIVALVIHASVRRAVDSLLA